MTFKIGDKVRKKSGETFSNNESIVSVIEIPEYHRNLEWANNEDCIWLDTGGSGSWLTANKLELVEEAKPVQYEDDWVLVKAGVTVPDDADVVRSQAGYVVAFRPVKKPKITKTSRWTSKRPGYATNFCKTSILTEEIVFTYTDGILTDVRLVK